jgi:hypothetical protein
VSVVSGSQTRHHTLSLVEPKPVLQRNNLALQALHFIQQIGHNVQIVDVNGQVAVQPNELFELWQLPIVNVERFLDRGCFDQLLVSQCLYKGDFYIMVDAKVADKNQVLRLHVVEKLKGR